MTDTLQDEKILLDGEKKTSEPGDHDLFAHYVEKDGLADAIINGTPMIALCGKVWVPHRNPDNFPTCPECIEKYEQLADE